MREGPSTSLAGRTAAGEADELGGLRPPSRAGEAIQASARWLDDSGLRAKYPCIISDAAFRRDFGYAPKLGIEESIRSALRAVRSE